MHVGMRMLAALMLSMTLLTTAFFAHALVTHDQRPALQPASHRHAPQDQHSPVVGLRGP